MSRGRHYLSVGEISVFVDASDLTAILRKVSIHSKYVQDSDVCKKTSIIEPTDRAFARMVAAKKFKMETKNE
jgi:hypothetical protein